MSITVSEIILLLGVVGALLRYMILNSKCSNISFCFGLIKIQRDTQAELELQEAEINAGVNISGDDK